MMNNNNQLNGLVKVKTSFAIKSAKRCLEKIKRDRNTLYEKLIEDNIKDSPIMKWWMIGYKNDWKHPLKWFRSYKLVTDRESAIKFLQEYQYDVIDNLNRTEYDAAVSIMNLSTSEHMYVNSDQLYVIRKYICA
jgi:hypothetical protein